MKVAPPSRYVTQRGLLQAIERLLQGVAQPVGQSRGMWLHNARHEMNTRFGSDQEMIALQQRYSITRVQDLVPLKGHGPGAVFGCPLPTRPYGIGDNISGLGTVTDVVNLEDGYSVQVNGQWIHSRCFERSQP